MIGAATIINPVIKIVTTVAINGVFDGSRGSQPQRLHDCIQRAFDAGGTPSARQVDRCVRRFGPG